MKNFPKAGLLIITLVIPALIFVFLRFFARNHYDLPYFNPERNASGEILIQRGDTIFHQVKNQILPSKGNSINGHLTVVSYLPEVCDDSCSLALSQLQRINATNDKIPEVSVLTLTTDLEKQKVRIAELGSGSWKFEKDSLGRISSFFNKELGYTPELSGISNMFTLIDTKGFIRGYYKGTDPEEIDRLMAEIKILAYEGKSTK
jgi:hypothetical protein